MSTWGPPPVAPPAEDADQQTRDPSEHVSHPLLPGIGTPSLPATAILDASQVAATPRRFEQASAAIPVAQSTKPPCERPAIRPALRRVIVGVGMLATLAAIRAEGIANVKPGETLVEPSVLRAASLVLVGLYLGGLGLFGWWHHRMRRTLHELTGSGPLSLRWSIGWVLLPAVAAPIAYFAVDRNTHGGIIFMGCLVAALIRVSMLREMASNVARVAPLLKARAGLWGVAVTWSDVMIIGVGIYGISRPEMVGDQLKIASLNLIFALAMGTSFLLLFTKRAERGALEFWDNKYSNPAAGVTQMIAKIDFSSEDIPINTRRLLPLAPIRYLVMVSYWAVAAAALWNGSVIWSLRDELTFSSDPEATVDRLLQSVLIFGAALLVMQFIQGVWSVGQAWNAQRCTLGAPSPLGMAVLFSLGPIAILLALSLRAPLALVGAAVLLNVVCWGFSFGLLSRTIESLGRSGTSIRTWGAAVSLHWFLGFASAPLSSLDDLSYASATAVLALLDAAIFIFASIVAWKAMTEFEAATRDHDQVRRIRRKPLKRSNLNS